MKNWQMGSLLLRLGLAFSFLYAGISSLVTPTDWVGYLPHFIAATQRPDSLRVFSIFEVGLALWLLVGRYTKQAAAFAALALFGVVVFNLNLFLVTFRDVGLIFAALALLFITNGK